MAYTVIRTIDLQGDKAKRCSVRRVDPSGWLWRAPSSRWQQRVALALGRVWVGALRLLNVKTGKVRGVIKHLT